MKIQNLHARRGPRLHKQDNVATGKTESGTSKKTLSTVARASLEHFEACMFQNFSLVARDRRYRTLHR